MNLKDIGETLKNARTKKNITKETLYKKTRIHPGVIDAIEDGTILDTLSMPYAKAFLRKYADFLGVNSKQILRDFDALNLKAPAQVLELKEEVALQEKKKSWIAPLRAIAALVGILFILFLGLRIISSLAKKISTAMEKKPVSAARVEPKKAQDATSESQTPALKKEGPFALTLKTRDDTWIRISKDGQKVFEGMLPRGSAEQWRADKRIDIRCGKAEALELILDGKSRGIVGEGVKNIIVTKDSVEIR